MFALEIAKNKQKKKWTMRGLIPRPLVCETSDLPLI
jgi:hypothetical protein